MQVIFGFGFVLVIGFFVLPGQTGSLGGKKAITEDDSENVKVAKEMVIKYVKENHTDEQGYETTSIDFCFTDITKQVVAGSIYNLKWNTTYHYKAVSANFEEKPSKTQTCSARVWFKLNNGGAQFATDGEPKCEDSE